jgi:hypothetical protein
LQYVGEDGRTEQLFEIFEPDVLVVAENAVILEGQIHPDNRPYMEHDKIDNARQQHEIKDFIGPDLLSQ